MTDGDKIQYIKIDDIIPNRFQPREKFDEEGLEDLSESIKHHGIIQPIIVRKLGDKYELIAGERRTKASSLAGLTTIPAIVRDIDDKESAKISLLENLQRKNLTAIEEAKTYKRILELEGMTQEELARTMGRSQPMVANKLRLLSLPEEIQESLVKNQISERHARSLLTIKDKREQLMFLDRIKKERLTVRDLDKEIKKYKEEKESSNMDIPGLNNEEENMNNNRSNFGGMGLNDYQTGIGNNMFNNIPNNFNNMASPVNEVNQSDNYDYNQTGNDVFSNQSNFVSGNNGMNLGSQQSLGSMFDGGINQSTSTMNNMSNNQDNNLFISQIREDNVPKKENQFLPNFDDDNYNSQLDFPQNNEFNSNNFTPFMNDNYSTNFNSNNQISNNMEPINYSGGNNNPSMYNGMNSDPVRQSYDNGIMNNYNQPSTMNYEQMPQNEFYSNSSYQKNVSPTGIQMPSVNQNMYDNSMNMNQANLQPNNFSVNNDFAMNSFENYNPYNQQNDNRIPDFGNGNNYYTNPTGGSLFNQPLNIVGPYGTQSVNNQSSYEQQPMTPQSFEQPMRNQEPTSMYSQPVEKTIKPSIDESSKQMDSFEPPYETSKSSFEKPDDNSETSFEKPISIEDKEMTSFEEKELEENDKEEENHNLSSNIEVIGENDIPIPTNNQEYINIDNEITIHNTHDAVMELKKTTDKIKSNNIDIDTEEIEFDDIYQITIKIKKEEN